MHAWCMMLYILYLFYLSIVEQRKSMMSLFNESLWWVFNESLWWVLTWRGSGVMGSSTIWLAEDTHQNDHVMAMHVNMMYMHTSWWVLTEETHQDDHVMAMCDGHVNFIPLRLRRWVLTEETHQNDHEPELKLGTLGSSKLFKLFLSLYFR